MFLEARLEKRFPEFALDVGLSARRGEFVTLLGPSGSGKSTVLMLLAGLVPLDKGFIRIDGADFARLPPERRGFGVVFQEKMLFPHLSVFENAAFGLRVRNMPVDAAWRALDSVGMRHLAHRSVASLSGGERQRAAVARAIAFGPRLLLLDEPLKELDAVVREKIKVELKRLQHRLGITTIYVTHDVEEAFFLSDRVVILHDGRSVQSGAPLAVFRRPADPFVREFFSPYRLEGIGGRQFLLKKSGVLPD
ncbi:MAG: ABC transporter ATP-binding protein [Candidatus Micrarchaeota archaeon]